MAKLSILPTLTCSFVLFFLFFSATNIFAQSGDAAVSVSGIDATETTSAELAPSLLLESVAKGDIEGIQRF